MKFNDTYRKYIAELTNDTINETQLSFNKMVYPKNGNVVILAGGAGSGKSFSIAHAIGLEGKVIDNDKLREYMTKSEYFKKMLKDEYDMIIDDPDTFFKEPANVTKLYNIFAEKHIDEKYMKMLLNALKLYAEKPNLIFDRVVGDIDSFEELCKDLVEVGYEKNNIHIVWVLTPIEEAQVNNADRKRVLYRNVVASTHLNAAKTMNMLFGNSEKLREIMDGDWYVFFNSKGVDSDSVKVGTGEHKKLFVKDFSYLKLKDAGADVKTEDSMNDNEKELFEHLKDYVSRCDDNQLIKW